MSGSTKGRKWVVAFPGWWYVWTLGFDWRPCFEENSELKKWVFEEQVVYFWFSFLANLFLLWRLEDVHSLNGILLLQWYNLTFLLLYSQTWVSTWILPSNRSKTNSLSFKFLYLFVALFFGQVFYYSNENYQLIEITDTKRSSHCSSKPIIGRYLENCRTVWNIGLEKSYSSGTKT